MSRTPHYLRSERRRLALTQIDVGFLLGIRTRTKVSRYERAENVPSLQTALAYEAIFAKPAAALFAAMFDEIRKQVARRARRRLDTIRSAGIRELARKESLARIATDR
jgi:transcriptional regulator with XRE-family HTH domain